MQQVQLKRTKYIGLLLSSVLLAGCVSSTIDTPDGFVSTLEQPSAAEVLSVSAIEAAPDAVEPADVGNEAIAAKTETTTLVAAKNVPADTLVATPPETAALSTGTTAPGSDVASQRILGAQNAPIAGGETPIPAAVSTLAATAPTAPINNATTQRPSGLLSALFGNSNQKPPSPVGSLQKSEPKVASAASNSPANVVATSRATGSTVSLPGVDRNRALGVAEVTESEESDEPIQVASAAGLGRLTPNGLSTQHSKVDVKCLKPALVRVLKTVEKKFGKPVVVTSGYRSPARNKSARGAKNSLHMYCAAADIQVEGVDKWALAKYLRSLPGRGGVGTYCHTNSIHVDIGPNRDWNWRCRRKK